MSQMTLLAADSAKKKRTSRKRVRKRIKANRITDEERKLSRYPTKQLLHDARLAQARSMRGGVGSSLSRSAPVLPTAHPADARGSPAPTPAPAGATMGAATVTAAAGAAVPPSVDTGGNAETGLDPRSMSPIELRRRSSGRIRARDIEHLTPAERLALMQERCVVALCGLLCGCGWLCSVGCCVAVMRFAHSPCVPLNSQIRPFTRRFLGRRRVLIHPLCPVSCHAPAPTCTWPTFHCVPFPASALTGLFGVPNSTHHPPCCAATEHVCRAAGPGSAGQNRCR